MAPDSFWARRGLRLERPSEDFGTVVTQGPVARFERGTAALAVHHQGQFAAATLSFGTSNFLISLTFLSLIKAAGNSLTFAIFAAYCILTLIFVRYVIPETKGRELESISARQTVAAP